MTPLRKKMEEDLRLRGLAQGTRYHYLRCVRIYAVYFRRSPDKLHTDHVRQFLLHLRDLGRAPATIVVFWAALRFFYVVTLNRPDIFVGIPRPRVPRQPPPVVLGWKDVAAILEAPNDLLDRALLTVTYGCGLRASEACALQVGDIDARADLLHVRHGKGDKPRSVPLPSDVLLTLRAHWRSGRPPGPWIFPARVLVRPGLVYANRWADHPISTDTLRERLYSACKGANIKHHVTPHDLRHSYASHLLAAGIDSRVIQVILGHERPETTAVYTHVTPAMIQQTTNALEVFR